MSAPVVALLYEHGRFGLRDTERTAAALVMYCVGLPAFAAVGVLTRAFYALGETRQPVQASAVSVALNIALNLALMRPLGHLGLALATSVTACVNLLQLALLLRRRLGRLEGRRMMSTALRVASASAVAAGVCAAGLALLGPRAHGRWLTEAAVVAGSLAVALPAGWAAMKALRVEELGAAEEIARALRSRLLGRRRPGAG
jgi:putative peptidoglycan lipid II flippase